MTVSVVITCYNLERYIGAALDSAFAALDKVGGEVIVVDDGSTDRSVSIIRSRDRARLVKTPSNGGVMQAMLAGLEAAHHPIVALLDGDDLWHPDKLVEVVRRFADPEVALVTHDLRFIDGEGTELARTTRPSEEMSRLAEAEWPEHLRRSVLEHRDDIWLGSALSVHRDRADLAGFASFIGQRSDRAELYQDWPLAAWIAVNPEVSLAYVPRKLMQYRLHGANHSGDAANLERARRNFRRNRNTLALMGEIAERRGKPTPKLLADIAMANAQAALYDGDKAAALRFAANARRSFTPKEAARFATLSVLGPRRGHRLLKWAARDA